MSDKEYFSIVIPTMWRSSNLLKMLVKYQESDYIKEIILIDNDPENKLDFTITDKITYITKGHNMFVNPSWNYGVSLCNYEILIVNDDIIIDDIDEVINLIIHSDYDILGVKMGKKTNDIGIREINEFPMNHYGSFLYVKNYTYIPEQIKIWYGDNILFDFSKKRGIIENAGIHSNSSSTVSEIKNSSLKTILSDDKINYENLKSNDGKFNIIIRTSGRPNFFKYCIKSIERFYPDAKLHITIDNEDDLGYVKNIVTNIEYSYYILNKETLENTSKKIKLNRDKPFVYNYYFNVVKPFLNGWCMYLDDDDVLVKTPDFDITNTDIVHLYRADVTNKIVPSDKNFGEKPVINDISTLCVILHSKNLVDWIPNRGGDFDFISELYTKYPVKWHYEINSACQKGGNFGKRNDLSDEIINGFYLNLSKRIDRKDKMGIELNKTKHLITRFEAIDGNTITDLNGFVGSIKNSEYKQYATYLSHLNMLKIASKNKWDKVIILEDDITLSNDFDDRLDKLIKELPTDWKMVYLGFNSQKNTTINKINQWVYSVNNVYGCFGMLINGNFLEELISTIENHKTVIDEVIHKIILPNHKIYSFIPFLLYVNDDYSDLWNKNRELVNIKNLYLPIIDFKTDYSVNDKYPFLVSSNKTCLLSIIIPTYNNPTLLNETLNSIIACIKDLKCEILIGIDGCQKTLDFVKQNLFDDRIKFYFFEKNVGPYIIKNSLSQISNSDYILFFDSDDIMKPELIDDIITNKNSYELIKPMYLDFQKDVMFIDNKILLSKTYGEGVFGIKKELFLRFNGFEGWRCAADSDLMGRLYKNKVKLTHTKRIGFYRRIHSDSLTQRPETNFFSPLRAKYASISKNKKYHGPLEKLTVEPFKLIKTLSSQYEDEKVFITKEEKIESIKQKLGFETKQESNKLNYDIINNLNNNPRSYNPSKHIKPIRENIPVNRNELFEIKRGTLAEHNREFFPMKRKLDL